MDLDTNARRQKAKKQKAHSLFHNLLLAACVLLQHKHTPTSDNNHHDIMTIMPNHEQPRGHTFKAQNNNNVSQQRSHTLGGSFFLSMIHDGVAWNSTSCTASSWVLFFSWGALYFFAIFDRSIGLENNDFTFCV